MLLVGLTGNIASGKSTVARSFAKLGATIIDADVLARSAVQIGTPAHAAIVRRWGEEVLAPDGVIDRAALRERVFSDHAELEELNAIVHPEVARLRERLMADARARGDRIVVCDIPLLFERHLAGEFDRIVLVDAPRDTRLERLVRDRRLREDEGMSMISAQMPAELKRARADFVIDNDGSRPELEARAAAVWGALEADAARRAAGAPAETAPEALRGARGRDVGIPRGDAAPADAASPDALVRDAPPSGGARKAAGSAPASAASAPPSPEAHP